MNKLRFVKLLVFFLTFLLIFGMISAGYMVYNKVSHQKPSITVNLEQPKGSYIAEIKPTNDTLYLFIKGGNLSDRIIAIRQSNNSVAASININ